MKCLKKWMNHKEEQAKTLLRDQSDLGVKWFTTYKSSLNEFLKNILHEERIWSDSQDRLENRGSGKHMGKYKQTYTV